MAAVNLYDFEGSVAELTRSTHVATISGDLDLYNSDDLRGQIAPLTALDDETLIVEMSGVTFIDSTALGVLTGAAKLLRARGGRLVIASGDPRFQRLLEINGPLRVRSPEPNHTRAVARYVDDTSL